MNGIIFSSVQQYEFLSGLSQPFSFSYKGNHNVEESSRTKDGKRTCGRENLDREQSSSFDQDASNAVRTPQQDSESVRKHQERNEDITGQGSCGKLQRGVENQLDRTRIDYHNMQKSQTINTLRKSPVICDRNCVPPLIHSMRRPMY